MIVGQLSPSNSAGLIGIKANLGFVSVLSGTYDLINYTGTIGGAGTSAFTLSSVGGLSSRQTASLLYQSNQIDVVVLGTTPFWNGNQSDWVAANAFTLQPGGALTTFQTGDADVFDDTASGTFGGNVTLSTTNVAPASVTFNNSNVAYTLNGNLGITGTAAVALTGNGTVTIANSNSYTGTTTIGSLATLQIGSGGTSGSLSPASAIVDNGTLAFSRSDNIVQGAQFSSAGITGGGNLNQLGPGMVTLTATNTFTGLTTISGGTLQLGNGVAGQDGTIAGVGGVSNNGTLVYNVAGSQTVSYAINGIGSMIKSGSGTLVLNAADTYSGGTTVTAGTLQLNTAAVGGVGTLQPSALVTVNSGATLKVNATDALGYYVGAAGPISVNSGTITIAAGIHTNLGYLTMTAGTLTSQGPGDTSGNYILNASVTTDAAAVPSVINANTLQLRGPNNGGATGRVPFYVARGTGPVDLIVSSNLIPVSTASGLEMVGPGVMWFTGATSTYAGGTQIDGGTLQLGAGGTTGSLPAASVISNFGALAFNRSDNIVQGTQFSSSPINGSGSLIQVGPGTLTLNAANTYTGPTVISGGVLNATSLQNEGTASAIGAGSGFPTASDLVIDNGTLQYTGATAQNSNWLFTVGPTGLAILDASGGPTGSMTLGSNGGSIVFANNAAAATLTLTGSGAGTLGASIGDSGTAPFVTSLVKMGSGTWTINGANSYSGTTSVNGGTLYLNSANNSAGPLKVNAGSLYVNGSLGSPSISVASGATLGGTGSLTSAGANVANGGTLDLSQNAGNTFSLASLNFAGHATIKVDALANYTSIPVLNSGPLAISSSAGLVAIDANLGMTSVVSGTYDLISYTGSIGGAGLSGFSLAVNGIGNRQHASLVNVSNQIEVVVTGAEPFWNGNQSDWAATNAFTLQPGVTLTTFQTNDTVTFDDTATGSFGGNVALNIANVAPAATVFNNHLLSYTLSGAYGITGTGSLSVMGSGLVTIANSNGYTGATIIGSNGTLQIGSGGASGSLSPSSAIVDNGSLAFSRSDSIVQGTQFSSSGITGLGGLTQLGPGKLTLTTTNTYSGLTTISGGTLRLGTGVAGQDGSIAGTSGVIDYSTLAYDLAGSQTASYSIGGSGNLAVIGTGTFNLAGNNSYTGSTSVSNGVLQLGNSAAFGSTASLLINSGVVDLTGNSPVVGALSGGSSALITNNGSATATFTTNSVGVSTFAGTIANGTAVTAFTAGGSGNLILTGTSTYSGVTNVVGGTLTVAPGGAINSAGRMYVGGTNGAILNVAGGQINSLDNEEWVLWIGFYPNQPGTVNVSSGSLNLNGTGSAGIVGGLVLGGGGATGSPANFNQIGGLVNVGNGTIYLANEPGGVTNMAISGGTFNDGTNGIIIGERDVATLTVNAAAIVNFQGGVSINNNTSAPSNANNISGTFNVQGGTVTQSGGNFIVDNGTGIGTYDQTGGVYVFNSTGAVYIGNSTTSGTGIMTVSGGLFLETNGFMRVGQNSTSIGELTIGGGTSAAAVSVPYLVFANNSVSSSGSVLLSTGGTLRTGSVQQALGTGTFNFDGGTLLASGSSTAFMQGITTANVQDAGGVVNNGGYAISIAQNLQSGSINPVDGGLLFSGTGTTTLSGTNTYNGGTTVVGGTLILDGAPAILAGSSLIIGSSTSPGATFAMPQVAPASAAAVNLTPVPEPGTFVLLLFAAAAGLAIKHRRSRGLRSS